MKSVCFEFNQCLEHHVTLTVHHLYCIHMQIYLSKGIKPQKMYSMYVKMKLNQLLCNKDNVLLLLQLKIQKPYIYIKHATERSFRK